MIIVSTLGPLSGKMGAIVASRNKGGQYFRVLVIPTNPNTARQQAVRNWISWCATTWASTLTEAQREQWREWAQTHTSINALGQAISLTALDWYTRVNTRLLDCAATPLTTPDDLSVPDALLTMTFTIPTATTIAVAFTPVLPTSHRLVVWGSGPIGVGQSPNFRQMRLIGYSAADAVTPVTFTLPYTIPDAMNLKIYTGLMSDRGRVSTFLTDIETYTAP